MSIDKLSFIADVPDSYQKHIDQFTKIMANKGIHPTYPSSEHFQHSCNFNSGEFVLQYGRSVSSSRGRRVRFEFNPNKFDFNNIWYRTLFNHIPHFEGSDITRIDFAVDYFFPLDASLCTDKFKMKNFICNGRGGVESWYLGSPSSDCQIKIYNKKLEQKEKFKIIVPHDHWWRVEALCRNTKQFLGAHSEKFKNPFKNFSYVAKYDIDLVENDFIYLFLYYANRAGYQAAMRRISMNNHKVLKPFLQPAPYVNPAAIFEKQIFSVWTSLQEKLIVRKYFNGESIPFEKLSLSERKEIKELAEKHLYSYREKPTPEQWRDFEAYLNSQKQKGA